MPVTLEEDERKLRRVTQSTDSGVIKRLSCGFSEAQINLCREMATVQLNKKENETGHAYLR